MPRRVLCGMTWRNTLSFTFPFRGSHEEFPCLLRFFAIVPRRCWSAGNSDVPSPEDDGEAAGTGTLADGDCFGVAVTYSDSVPHSDPDAESHPDAYADAHAVTEPDDAGPAPRALDAA